MQAATTLLVRQRNRMRHGKRAAMTLRMIEFAARCYPNTSRVICARAVADFRSGMMRGK